MPKARILSHQIDKDSIETLDQKDGLFNPVKVEDVRNFDSVSQDAMEERAIENGILDKAFENAKNIIRKIIDNDFVEELGYTVCLLDKARCLCPLPKAAFPDHRDLSWLFHGLSWLRRPPLHL